MRQVTLISFGVKYGESTPLVECVISALPAKNPHKNKALRYLTGLDERVQRHVLTSEGGKRVLMRVLDAVQDHDTIGVACHGGHHRSVSIVERAAHVLREAGVNVSVHHRDVNKR